MTVRELHEIVGRIARKCRRIVQACLREEEWRDADQEFYRIIRKELDFLASGDDRQAAKGEGLDQGG